MKFLNKIAKFSPPSQQEMLSYLSEICEQERNLFPSPLEKITIQALECSHISYEPSLNELKWCLTYFKDLEKQTHSTPEFSNSYIIFFKWSLIYKHQESFDYNIFMLEVYMRMILFCDTSNLQHRELLAMTCYREIKEIDKAFSSHSGWTILQERYCIFALEKQALYFEKIKKWDKALDLWKQALQKTQDILPDKKNVIDFYQMIVFKINIMKICHNEHQVKIEINESSSFLREYEEVKRALPEKYWKLKESLTFKMEELCEIVNAHHSEEFNEEELKTLIEVLEDKSVIDYTDTYGFFSKKRSVNGEECVSENCVTKYSRLEGT